MNMIEAIAAHRAAYDAWQNSPDDDGQVNSKFIRLAQNEIEAQVALIGTCVTNADELSELVAHLEWFTSENPELQSQGESVTAAPFALLAAIRVSAARAKDEAENICMARSRAHRKSAEHFDDEDSRCLCLSDALEALECVAAIRNGARP